MCHIELHYISLFFHRFKAKLHNNIYKQKVSSFARIKDYATEISVMSSIAHQSTTFCPRRFLLPILTQGFLLLCFTCFFLNVKMVLRKMCIVYHPSCCATDLIVQIYSRVVLLMNFSLIFYLLPFDHEAFYHFDHCVCSSCQLVSCSSRGVFMHPWTLNHSQLNHTARTRMLDLLS